MEDTTEHHQLEETPSKHHDMLSLVLLLRYGKLSPVSGDRPILNLVTVARVTRLSPDMVTRMIKKYLSHGDTGDKMVTRHWRKLLPHHIGFLTSSQTLQEWAPLSLKERSIMFHRRFPETVASPTTIAKVYRRHKITFKQIKRGKRHIDFADPYYSHMIADIHQSIKDCRANNIRVVFLDEAIFSQSTGPARAWASNNEVIEVDESCFNGKTQALIMAVSEDRGVDHFRIVPRSMDTQKFILFLQELSEKNEGQRLAVFMDNLRVHRSRLALAEYQNLGIRPIFNVPYSPQFNGIEAVFSMVKAAYKKQLLTNILEGRTQQRPTLIKQAILNLDRERIARCVRHGLSEIEN